MAIAVPEWLIGRGITTITVTAQEFSGGVLATPAGQSAVDFFTVVDRIYYEHEVELVDVSPTTSRQRNMVILTTGGTFTLTENMRRASAGGAHSFNGLALLFHTWDYFRLVFTRAEKTYTFYAVNGGFTEEVGRGKSPAQAHFAPAGTVETGVAQSRNPSYT